MMPGTLPDAAAAHIAELTFEHLTLAIPLSDLHSLEPVLDVNFSDRTARAAGSILIGGASYPVYCLSDALAFDLQPPATRRICAIIDNGETVFGLICAAVAATPAGSHVAHELPLCMREDSSPIDSLELTLDRVLCRTSGASLGHFIASQVSS